MFVPGVKAPPSDQSPLTVIFPLSSKVPLAPIETPAKSDAAETKIPSVTVSKLATVIAVSYTHLTLPTTEAV